MLDPELAREERKLCGDFCGFELKDSAFIQSGSTSYRDASGTPFIPKSRR